MDLRTNGKEVILCGGKICCPRLIKLPSGMYQIIDDNGQSIVITAEQARLISAGVATADNINESKEELLLG